MRKKVGTALPKVVRHIEKVTQATQDIATSHLLSIWPDFQGYIDDQKCWKVYIEGDFYPNFVVFTDKDPGVPRKKIVWIRFFFIHYQNLFSSVGGGWPDYSVKVDKTKPYIVIGPRRLVETLILDHSKVVTWDGDAWVELPQHPNLLSQNTPQNTMPLIPGPGTSQVQGRRQLQTNPMKRTREGYDFYYNRPSRYDEITSFN